MIRIEIANESGVAVDEEAVGDLCRRVLDGEGVDDGDSGYPRGAGADAGVKREHLGCREATDVLSFPSPA